MLLRNLDVSDGLCNGTRMKIDHIGDFTIGCRFITGVRKGRLAVIPRIHNCAFTKLPFRFRRTQYPIRLAFAMTINKSQGQTLSKARLFVKSNLSSHGQLYVALSRVSHTDHIRIKTPVIGILNVVYPNVLDVSKVKSSRKNETWSCEIKVQEFSHKLPWSSKNQPVNVNCTLIRDSMMIMLSVFS